MSQAFRPAVSRRNWASVAMLMLALSGVVLTSMLVGSGQLDAVHSLAYLLSPGDNADAYVSMVMTELRLPRTLAGVIIGVALGVAGSLLQNVTRNPLAEPGLLGINAGAALGVVIGISFFHASSSYSMLIWAISGAMVGNGAVMLAAQVGAASMTPLRLVLAGVAINAAFQGVTSLLLHDHIAAFDQYRYWILGSLSGITMEAVSQIAPAVLAALVLAAALTRPLSALTLGDDSAKALGHNPNLIRALLSLSITLLSAAAVALAGPIVLLGLIAAYIARALAGHHLRNQLLYSAVAGAFLLLSADILARVINRPFEAPVSAVVAFIGVPIIIRIVHSNRMFS
ncbi:iron ABC transporter permease [Hahella sp. KA22]|uniref:FecCD family ABC transporter permease n=1 Tax=Hahella sp. KA22 TaxID=1628392 RepID=UPI0019D4E23F|nr:iron ABC transporter permease [Hahella sp. KA22]